MHQLAVSNVAERHGVMSELVCANLRLVAKIAKRHKGCGLPWHDLVQEGTIGLLTAADKFDATKGFRFSTYAYPWIRASIQRAVDNHATGIRIPTFTLQRINAMSRARATVYYATGRYPTIDELVDKLQLSAPKIERVIEADRRRFLLSLDAPLRARGSFAAGDSSLACLVSDKRENPQQRCYEAIAGEELRASLEEILTDEEHRTVSIKYGLSGQKPLSISKVGVALGMSTGRVRVIHNRALGKLRRALADKTYNVT